MEDACISTRGSGKCLEIKKKKYIHNKKKKKKDKNQAGSGGGSYSSSGVGGVRHRFALGNEQ